VDVILEHGRTGLAGDGLDVVRIRTKEMLT
jgi:hypothetical protein